MEKSILYSLLGLVLFSLCVAQENSIKKGLSEHSQKKLEALLAQQQDPEKFKNLLELLTTSGEIESLLILTYAMFELPWESNLIPTHSDNIRMPKLIIERTLDKLIVSQEHDKLSAHYFSAVFQEKNIEEAKNNLLQWLFTSQNKLKWNGTCFVLDSPKNEKHLQSSRSDTKWINVQNIGFEILNDKKEIELAPEVAKNIFLKQFPAYHLEWQTLITEKIEILPNAQTLPESDRFQKMFRASEDKSFAKVLAYSNREIIVKLLQPKGFYLWHQYYECLASFRVPRNIEIDLIFNISDLEKEYGREYKGIQQGSTPQQVLDTLGEPTEERITQALGFYFWEYAIEKIVIVFQNEQVKAIQDEIPEEE